MADLPHLTPQQLADATGDYAAAGPRLRDEIDADTRRAMQFGQFLDSLFQPRKLDPKDGDS